MRDTVELHLTNTDQVSLIDAEDLAKVSHINWFLDSRGYVCKNEYLGNQKWAGLKLHRVIMDAPDDLHVDHINLNKLDNRKSNLRLATPAQNARNRDKLSNNTSGYKGVSAAGAKWQANIRFNNHLYFLGNYENKEDAAKAYNVKAAEYFGEFARLNNVDHTGFNIREKAIPYSRFKGVWYHKNKNKWLAGIIINGHQHHIGSYGSEVDAAKAFNVYALKHLGSEAELNDVEHVGFNLKPKRQKTSQYIGVSLDKRRDKWKAHIKVDGKHKFMGYFESEHDAARMYNFWAADLLGASARLNVINEEESA